MFNSIWSFSFEQSVLTWVDGDDNEFVPTDAVVAVAALLHSLAVFVYRFIDVDVIILL